MKKRILSFITSVLLVGGTLGSVSAFAKNPSPESIRILCIGNSFSEDCVEHYLYPILQSLGVKEIVIGNLYIPGCSLAVHKKNFEQQSKAYSFRLISTQNNGVLVTKESVSIQEALAQEDWQYLSLQQASGLSGVAETYGDAAVLYEELLALCPQVSLLWNMTWAYQQGAKHADFPRYESDQTKMYQAIVNAVQTQILPMENVTVIPTGTTIQNARKAAFSDNLTEDGYHLNHSIGHYLASLTFAAKLTGMDIQKVDFCPDSVYGDEKALAIACVEKAIEEPFTVSKIQNDKNPFVGWLFTLKYCLHQLLLKLQTWFQTTLSC